MTNLLLQSLQFCSTNLCKLDNLGRNSQERESDAPHVGSDVRYWASQLWGAGWSDVINTVGGVESSSEQEGNSQRKMSHYELGR